MRGWRIKLIFLLIVYFAGFATAIYTLAPAPENSAASRAEKGFLDSVLKTDDFAKSFNNGMHKCIAAGKDAATRMAKFLKQKINETQAVADG